MSTEALPGSWREHVKTARKVQYGTALVLTLAACSATTETPRPVGISQDWLVAVCLDEDGEGMSQRLCTVDVAAQAVTGDDYGVVPDPATPIALSPDRDRVAYVKDGTVRLFELASGADSSTAVQGSAFAWIDDSRLLILEGSSHSEPTEGMTSGRELPPVVVDTRNGGNGQRTSRPSMAIPGGASLLPLVAASEGWVALGYQLAGQEFVTVRDAETLDELWSTPGPGDGSVTSVAIHRSAGLLLAVDDYRLFTHEGDGTWRRELPRTMMVTSPSISPDGRALVVVDARGALVDLSTTGLRVDVVVDQTGASQLAGLPVFPSW